MNFRPDRRTERPQVITSPPKRGQLGPIILFLQLLGLFLVVRIVMITEGLLFLHIPVIDPLLRDFIVVVERYLTIFGLM